MSVTSSPELVQQEDEIRKRQKIHFRLERKRSFECRSDFTFFSKCNLPVNQKPVQCKLVVTTTFFRMLSIPLFLLLAIPESWALLAPNSIITKNDPIYFNFVHLNKIRQNRIQTSPHFRHSTHLQGIRGFRSWFESQFPDAMTTLHHTRQPKNNHKSTAKEKNKSQDKRKKKQQQHAERPSDCDTFHHVLIDVNQLLHVTLRRSRTEGHALTLLIQELDKCTDIAIPTRSVVLAFDGPPAAAKLAVQRRRRYGTVISSARRKARLQRLIERGIVQVSEDEFNEDENINNRAGKKRKKNKQKGKRIRIRKDNAKRDEESLAITPGTDFMKKAHNAVLYWAWQRLLNPKGKLAKCRIYISPSTVPGEGEVKLLDWLTQAGTGYKNRSQTKKMRSPSKKGSLEIDWKKEGRLIKPGESVAIMGGDSDLVLLSLVIPPTITHNVFVILPVGPQTSYSISLWETTRTLGRFLGDKFDPTDLMRVRTDLVLLLIMNGNDYLPKLRGSSGFNKLFHTYLRLLKKWLRNKNENRKIDGNIEPYLIDPDSLDFNIPFCISFFNELASIAPKSLEHPSEMKMYISRFTPLSHLYSLVDAGFLPRPARFVRLSNHEWQEHIKKGDILIDQDKNSSLLKKMVF